MKHFPIDKETLEKIIKREHERRERHIKETPLTLKEEVKALVVSLNTLVDPWKKSKSEYIKHIREVYPEERNPKKYLKYRTLDPIKIFNSLSHYYKVYKRHLKEVKSGEFHYMHYMTMSKL